MKLSISQYNEIFNDRSITNYTKFNWLKIQPSGFNVSNLVEGCVGTNATILKHNSNDIQDYEWINTNSYGGIQKIYLVSSLQYGDYRYHFDINYSTNSIYFIVYNVTKGKRIIELISNDGTFTLTPENYSVGDDIQIKAYMADNGSTASISNFYLCKIQDDWILFTYTNSLNVLNYGEVKVLDEIVGQKGKEPIEYMTNITYTGIQWSNSTNKTIQIRTTDDISTVKTNIVGKWIMYKKA